MKIGILLCVVDKDIMQRDTVHITNFLQRVDSSLSVCAYDVQAGEYPDSANECDAYITTGSEVSVSRPEAWIQQLTTFVQYLHKSRKKLIGICFGHQLIAQSLGGTVQKSMWAVGMGACTIYRHMPWMSSSYPRFVVWMGQSHYEQVVRLPDRAVVVGGAPHCLNYLVQYTPYFLGIQGHPELPATELCQLYDSRRSVLGRAADQAIREVSEREACLEIGQWCVKFLSKN